MSITKDGLFKYQALNERQRKNLMILDTIRKKGPISKASLSKQLKYSVVTLSNYLEEYFKKGFVREAGMDISSGGRRPVLLELNKEEVFLIGIDFNRESMDGILTDFMLNVISEVKLPRPQIEQGPVEESLAALINEVIKNSGVDVSKIKFIAAGVYGSIGEKNAAIKGLDEDKGKSRATIYFTNVKKAIEEKFNIRTFFGEGASFAAFGERAKNLDAESENLLYIFQDVGSGVVIKGEIYCGTNLGSVDLEGVIGALSDEEKLKFREKSPYLKPWDSQMSLKNEARKVIERGVGTKIVELLKGNMEALSDDIIIKAAQENDEIAIELIEGVAINLGVRIAYLINLFSPQVVIVGGGIEKAGELLFGQVKKTIEKLSLEKASKVVKILPSTLGERAVSLGAASVALRESFLEA
ncbi:MAG: ROK family protein [Candidatus Omnitrophica bacterium]|nr:ROK family protein [Candidatus Omnitrophota bacterium]